jgi:pyroglutamyl-peptidase
MRKLLVTGFEPFGGESINPSWEAVIKLQDRIGDFCLSRLLVPVVFGEGADKIIKKAEEISPDVILCIGQAGGRDAITPEMVGINLRFASIPDNGGNQPKDEKIDPDGENAYFSTLPVRKIVEAVNNAGIPSRASYSAGAYVCNDVIYTLLSHFKDTETKVGFIHIPYCKEQGKEPCMELEKIVNGLTIAIESID